MMSRLFFWRSICLLAQMAGVLQIVGFFLPYSMIVNTTTNSAVRAISYWLPLARFLQVSAFEASFSLFILLTILIPAIIAFMELVRQPRGFSIPRLVGLCVAFLGFLLFSVWSFVSTSMSICTADAPPRCDPNSVVGAGFWPMFLGFFLSVACFIVLFVLGFVWWWRAPRRKAP